MTKPVVAIVSVRARELGKVLHWLEYDTAIEVLGWHQNVHRTSKEVELKVRSAIFPAQWQHAELGVTIFLEGADVRMVWTASIDDEHHFKFERVRPLQHRRKLGWLAHISE